jgi:hypothetical protein
VIPEAAVAHYAAMQRLGAVAAAQVRRLWLGVSASDFSASWREALPSAAALLGAAQFRAALAGSDYGASALAEQGVYEAPAAFVDPSGFSGVAADGGSLSGLLYTAAPYAKERIAGGMDAAAAKNAAAGFLMLRTRTAVADAARGAASVDVASRPRTGYVRMLNAPSCSRCVILAGKFYRWNKGFQRHPGCDCRHVPSTENVAGDATTDPYAYFESLSGAEQDRIFGAGSAQAIRDGGDMFQVVNARRGMKPGGVTTEGTSKRGFYGNTRGQRLTPDAIYAKGLSREQTLRELERYGYILPGGQNPQGVIRGQREGFGQMGRGGTRVGAREAVLRARETGVRDPNALATMTAAERRVFDAQANWDAVREGRNPFGRGKLTPQLSAAAENDFRRIILQGDAAAKITARRSMGG